MALVSLDHGTSFPPVKRTQNDKQLTMKGNHFVESVPLPRDSDSKDKSMNNVAENRADSSVLPVPSEEQMAVIGAIQKGYCVTVPSVAGSGKTTCMLQIVANLPSNRRALIITYNRSLADECKLRIQKCGLQSHVTCYTIHGFVSFVSGSVCNDDTKLGKVVRQWEAPGSSLGVNNLGNRHPLALDLVLLDEVQDLRPLFYKALRYILKNSPRLHSSSPLQLCLVGDPKQLLYDFPTYGNDKASPKYMQNPVDHWDDITNPRQWKSLPLSVSYRLTPNIAAFVNTFWGTNIIGGNSTSENLPVEYCVKYPYPPKTVQYGAPKLTTQFLSSIIDKHGPENVMFLAQSVKSENCPIRVHANQLMKIQNDKGQQKYNFHIKEGKRGFEGKANVKNKVRVWTFCGSKGCEADVVVVFGLDISPATGKIHSLNQVGVALSRARKRLIVIHCMHYERGEFRANTAYPILGDSPSSVNMHTIQLPFSKNDSKTISKTVSVPAYKEGDKKAAGHRAKLGLDILKWLTDNRVVTLNGMLPREARVGDSKQSEVMYVATEFEYFSAAAEMRFINSYASWNCESSVRNRIDYNTEVQFQQTKEDVSALYGEAVVYMLQWERDGYCPNIETVVNDGILQFDLHTSYKEQDVLNYIRKKECEPLTPHYQSVLTKAFSANSKMTGKDLIQILNTRIKLRKKRQRGTETIFFTVKAVEKRSLEDDSQLKAFLPQIRAIYQLPIKEPWHWVYIANATMAFSNYYEKFYQIGTHVDAYESWVNSDALTQGLSRLRSLMDTVPLTKMSNSDPDDFDDKDQNAFEFEMFVEFEQHEIISSPNDGRRIIGVQGICDWVGKGLRDKNKEPIDLLEIKFVQELSNNNRLQVLVYCALMAIEIGRGCRGVLYNARTEEKEACFMKFERAKNFLLDISQFKFNGKERVCAVESGPNRKRLSVVDIDEIRNNGGHCKMAKGGSSQATFNLLGPSQMQFNRNQHCQTAPSLVLMSQGTIDDSVTIDD